MYTSTIALAIAPLLYLAHADVSLDRDDVPRACDTICDPIVQLTQKCDSDRWGDAQEIQCVCTNDSFNVERIAALCADCIHQNASRDDDDDETENIDDILFTCAFPSTTYVASAASAAVSGVSVDASLPTNPGEFTWIIGGTTTRDSNQATSTNGSGGSGGNSNNNNNDNTASATNDASSPDETNAAAAMAPAGVLGAVVGAAMLLA